MDYWNLSFLPEDIENIIYEYVRQINHSNNIKVFLPEIKEIYHDISYVSHLSIKNVIYNCTFIVIPNTKKIFQYFGRHFNIQFKTTLYDYSNIDEKFFNKEGGIKLTLIKLTNFPDLRYGIPKSIYQNKIIKEKDKKQKIEIICKSPITVNVKKYLYWD